MEPCKSPLIEGLTFGDFITIYNESFDQARELIIKQGWAKDFGSGPKTDRVLDKSEPRKRFENYQQVFRTHQRIIMGDLLSAFSKKTNKKTP